MRNVVWTGVLLAGGCAYRAAVSHGEDAAAAQEWQQAYEAYRFANELKPGKADALVAEAREKAVEHELEAAASASAAGEHEQAYAHLEAAEALAPGASSEARERAREALVAAVAAELEEVEDLGEAYALVALARRLEPDSPEVEDAAASLRARVEDEAQALLDEGRYAEAHATASLMADLEPAQRTRGAAIEGQVEAAWVEHLVARAKGVLRSHPGLAAVYWTRAHEIGDDPAHAEAAKEALEAAAETAPIHVLVDTRGSGGRHWRLRKTLRAGLEDVAGVQPGWSSRWDLKVTASIPSERCTETRVSKPLEKAYQSGTKQVPNPAFAEVTEALAAAREEAEQAKNDHETKKAESSDAQVALRVAQGEHERTKRIHDEKVAALQATVVQIDATGQQVSDAEAELAALGAEAHETTVAQVKEKLELVRGFHADWNAKKSQDQAALDEAKAAFEAAEAELTAKKAAAGELTAALEAATTRLTEADARVDELVAKSAETPKELTEKVMDVAKVDETTWTLACDGPATVRYATRWETERQDEQQVQAKSETTDLERPGHEGAGIEADPKAYPKDKDALIAEIDQTAEQAIAAEIEAFVADYFARQVEDALAATEDLDAATDTLVALAVGAPERVDEATRAKIAAYLGEHHGLEDVAAIGVPAPPGDG